VARFDALVISRNDLERRRLVEALEGAGLQGEAYAAGPECLLRLEATKPDLLVVDIDAPETDRFDLVRRLTHQPWRPLVIAVASSERECIEALLEGVDVCVSRRTGAGLIAAQAHALLRRRQRDGDVGQGPSFLYAGGLRVDLERCEVSVDGRLIPFTPTEFRLVASLARRPGRVVGSLQLLSECGITPLSEAEARATAKVHIHRIRQKIGASRGSPSAIRNVRAFGYMLERRRAERRVGADSDIQRPPQFQRSA
jgi:two-component system response regulator RegX3